MCISDRPGRCPRGPRSGTGQRPAGPAGRCGSASGADVGGSAEVSAGGGAGFAAGAAGRGGVRGEGVRRCAEHPSGRGTPARRRRPPRLRSRRTPRALRRAGRPRSPARCRGCSSVVFSRHQESVSRRQATVGARLRDATVRRDPVAVITRKVFRTPRKITRKEARTLAGLSRTRQSPPSRRRTAGAVGTKSFSPPRLKINSRAGGAVRRARGAGASCSSCNRSGWPTGRGQPLQGRGAARSRPGVAHAEHCPVDRYGHSFR